MVYRGGHDGERKRATRRLRAQALLGEMWLAVPRLVGVAALATAAMGSPAGADNGQTTPESAVVQYRDLKRVAAAEGVVEAVRQSTLATQVAGRVVALNVRAGDAVRAGQVLVQIDARSAAQAEAASQSQLREARANFTNAKAKYERSRQLFAQKFISQAALDQAQAEFLAAQEQTSAAIANAGQAATSKSYATITAPYSGVVASTDVEVGDMATPGRPLLTVFDPRELRVTATVSQAVLAQARLQAGVTVEIPTLGKSVVAGEVTVIPVADTRTHTTRVRLALPESAGLLPGQYARALFVTGQTRALAIPTVAVLRRSEVTAVYVLDASGNARLRQVRLGEPAGEGLVEVLAGVAPGERVSLQPVRSGIEASKASDDQS
ncbi:MAG TPA: efflux RND transporter periplasmic adaptor subunit [Casimicrobiaceae bacterium]